VIQPETITAWSSCGKNDKRERKKRALLKTAATTECGHLANRGAVELKSSRTPAVRGGLRA